jgi:hypothetical protein
MGWNWFAIFLWEKSAPGGAEKIVPSETRESLTDRQTQVDALQETEGSDTEIDV